MAELDLLLDDDGDLVIGDDGDLVLTPTASSAVRHQMLDELDAWVGDATAGRVLRPLAGNSQPALDAEIDSVRNALLALEADGLVTDVEVEGERVPPYRQIVRASSRDAETGELIVPADLLTEFGG